LRKMPELAKGLYLSRHKKGCIYPATDLLVRQELLLFLVSLFLLPSLKVLCITFLGCQVLRWFSFTFTNQIMIQVAYCLDVLVFVGKHTCCAGAITSLVSSLFSDVLCLPSCWFRFHDNEVHLLSKDSFQSSHSTIISFFYAAGC